MHQSLCLAQKQKLPLTESLLDKQLSLIAALARNRAIGLDGRMPWHLPDELAHFKRVTLGKPVVMGRKTWEAIGRPLPGRQNIIISRNPNYDAIGAEVVTSLRQACEIAHHEELMIIGGGELYALVLPLASRMFLTIVDCQPEADTWFPRYPEQDWRLISSERHLADERHAFQFEMCELARR